MAEEESGSDDERASKEHRRRTLQASRRSLLAVTTRADDAGVNQGRSERKCSKEEVYHGLGVCLNQVCASSCNCATATAWSEQGSYDGMDTFDTFYEHCEAFDSWGAGDCSAESLHRTAAALVAVSFVFAGISLSLSFPPLSHRHSSIPCP